MKSFCSSRSTVKKVKRQPKECEEKNLQITSNKGLVSRMYKELQLNNKQQPD